VPSSRVDWLLHRRRKSRMARRLIEMSLTSSWTILIRRSSRNLSKLPRKRSDRPTPN
jgi:hypothetical protein